MELKQLHLVNYRNYKDINFSFSSKFNIISGKNGMGKTNLLDSIYFLCVTKSYHTTSDKNVVRRDESFLRIKGQIEKKDKNYEVVAKVALGEMKEISVNTIVMEKFSNYIGMFPIVFFIPSDQKIVSEGPDERRKWMDSAISQVNHMYLIEIMNYQKILKQRNTHLKSLHVNEELLQIYDHQLSDLSINITKQRSDFVNSFNVLFNDVYQKISGNAEKVFLQYDSDCNDGLLLKDKLLAHRKKDIITQRTSFGNHRDDILFHLNDVILKSYASQGQIKNFVLSLKLTQYLWMASQSEIKPILMLDDIHDKFDKFRLANLFSYLNNESFGQVFLTDTDYTRILPHISSLENYREECSIFEIKEGMLVTSPTF
ncbi:MAG: DNA replication and repair protein RecF [Saprospiraceae bacterium]|nr:DNA replication and repair protein RecF [Saprospiraceae bacterium]